MAQSKSLTEGPVANNLARLGLPMIFGIIAVLSVSLVDTYFVGKLGTSPLAALSFTFPVTLTVASLSIGLSAGAASIVSRAIGGGNKKDARRLSTDALFLAVVLVAIISAIGYFLIRPLFSVLGASGEILDMITRYMEIWFISMPFLVVPMVANGIIRAAGDAFWPSLIMIGAAVVNIATTPMFIFGFGPIPALDIEGAAWGTLVARVFTLFLTLYILIAREKLLSLVVPPIKELMESWQRILAIGIPAALGNATNPVGIAIVTAIIAAIGAQEVAAFGVATRLESFACIPMLALSSAIGPMVGQNWGAGKKDRVLSSIKISYMVCAAWALLLALVFWFFGESIAGVLASEDAVAQESATYLRIVPITLWGYGIAIVAAGAYNALGKSVTGFGFYLVRTAALYVPLSWLASIIAGSEAIYIGIAVSNVAAGTIIGVYSIWWLSRTDTQECKPRSDACPEPS